MVLSWVIILVGGWDWGRFKTYATTFLPESNFNFLRNLTLIVLLYITAIELGSAIPANMGLRGNTVNPPPHNEKIDVCVSYCFLTILLVRFFWPQNMIF